MGLDFDAVEYCRNVKSKQLSPPYNCPVSKCGRTYKTLVGLQYHLLNYDHDNPQPAMPVMSSSRKKARSRGTKHHHHSTYKGSGGAVTSGGDAETSGQTNENGIEAVHRSGADDRRAGAGDGLKNAAKGNGCSSNPSRNNKNSGLNKNSNHSKSGGRNCRTSSDEHNHPSTGNGRTSSSAATSISSSSIGSHSVPSPETLVTYNDDEETVTFNIEGKSVRLGIHDPLPLLDDTEYGKLVERGSILNANSRPLEENASWAKVQVPEARVQQISDYNVPDAPARPLAYYRFIEKSAEELDGEIEYDVDEEDSAWLEWMNLEREKNGYNSVSIETMELLMDRLEKESYFQSAANGSNTGNQVDDDAVCCICMDGECQNTNVILFCDMCNLAVHQDCYGVPYIPEGQWLCRRCLQSPSTPVNCVLCPNTGGAFKQTDRRQWAHVVCALWIPEVRFANTVFLEPIDSIETIPSARWRLTCYVCKEKGLGACIQCHRNSCYAAFHVTCAQQAGLYMTMDMNEGANLDSSAHVQKYAFCHSHTPEHAKSKLNLKDFEDARHKMKEARKALAKKRSTAPIVLIPTIPNERIQEISTMVQMQKKKDFMDRLVAYWTLKRKYRNGVPLLRRLQSQGNSNNINAITSQRANNCSYEKPNMDELYNQLKYWQCLRQDLERARLLCELVRKREKLKVGLVKIAEQAITLQLNPLESTLTTLLENLETRDTSQIFREPVNIHEVPDYLDIVTHPMDLSTMKMKLQNHQYTHLDEMQADFDLMIQNCLAYNNKDTIFYRAGLRMRDQAVTLFDDARSILLRQGLLDSRTSYVDHVEQEIEKEFQELLNSPPSEAIVQKLLILADKSQVLKNPAYRTKKIKQIRLEITRMRKTVQRLRLTGRRKGTMGASTTPSNNSHTDDDIDDEDVDQHDRGDNLLRRNCNNSDKNGRNIILEENHNVEDMDVDASIKSTPLLCGKNLKSSLTLTLKRSRRRVATQNHVGNSIYNEENDDDEDEDDNDDGVEEEEEEEDDDDEDDVVDAGKVKTTNGRRPHRKMANYGNINKSNDLNKVPDTNVNNDEEDDEDDEDDDDEAAINELARRGNNSHLVQTPTTSPLKNLSSSSSPVGVNRRTAVLFTRKAQAALKKPLDALTNSPVKMEHHHHHHNNLNNNGNNHIGGINTTNAIVGGGAGILVSTNINSNTMTAIAATGSATATTNLSTTSANTLTINNNLAISGAGSACASASVIGAGIGIGGTLLAAGGITNSGPLQGQGVLSSNLGTMNSSTLVVPPIASILSLSTNKYNNNCSNVNSTILSNQLTALNSMVIGGNPVASTIVGGGGSGKSPKRNNPRYNKRQATEMRNNDCVMASGPLTSPKKSPNCTSILNNSINAITNNNSNSIVSSLSPTCHQLTASLPAVLSSSASTTSTASTLPVALANNGVMAAALPASPNTNLHSVTGLNSFNHIPDKFRVYRTNNDRDVSESDSEEHSHISGGSPCSSCSGFGLSCTGSELNSSEEDEDDDDEEDDDDDDDEDEEDDDDDDGGNVEDEEDDDDYEHENDDQEEDESITTQTQMRNRKAGRKTRELNNYVTRLTATNVQKAMMDSDASEAATRRLNVNAGRNSRTISCSGESESASIDALGSNAPTSTASAIVSSLRRSRGRQRKRVSPAVKSNPIPVTSSIVQKTNKTLAMESAITTTTTTTMPCSNSSNRIGNRKNISPTINSNHQHPRIASAANNLNNNVQRRIRTASTNTMQNTNTNSNSNNLIVNNNNSSSSSGMNRRHKSVDNSGSDDNISQILNNSGGTTLSNNSCSESSGMLAMDCIMKPPLEPLQLVWAKCRGYPWYPALILDPKTPKGFVYNGVPLPAPPTDVLALRKNYPMNLDVYLVLFFDVKRTWQWLPANKLEILGVDKEVDQQKLIESRKPTDRKAVKKAYQDALHYQSQVTDLEGQGPDPIM